MIRSLAAGATALAAILAAGLASPASATSTAIAAREVYEVHYVPTAGDAVIRVEVWRDTRFDAKRQPVILTYSPYNSLSEPEPARDAVGERYVPRGYARAVADVIGTRGSTGCWDYGGAVEQRSGIDLVRYLAHRKWANGRVAMIGGSYNGTTASMVAARGDRVPELKAIVPIAAISRWYGYAYGNGVRYFLNSQEPADEGFDTPLAFDLGFGKTVAADPAGPHFADTVRDRAAECGAAEHTAEGYSRNPDYDAFWLERDYRKDAHRFRAAVLLAHGWQDYNVKQEEATELYRKLPVDNPRTARVEGVPFKLMYLSQVPHGNPRGDAWQPLLDRFLARTLKGARNGVERSGPVITEGATWDGATAFRTERNYPLPSTEPTALYLRGTSLSRTPQTGSGSHVASYRDTATSMEETGLGGGLDYVSRPLARKTRLVGSAVLDAYVRMQGEGMHLTPTLLDVAPDGTARVIERGFLHVDYRNGLGSAEPAPGKWVRAKVRLLPQDYTLPAGHRIGLRVRSSNVVWAVPGNPGAVDLAVGWLAGVTSTGSRLVLPTIGGRAVF